MATALSAQMINQGGIVSTGKVPPTFIAML